MESLLLNGYKYIITYESRQTGIRKDAMIQMDFMQTYVDACIAPILKQQKDLKEPWFSLRPHIGSAQEVEAVSMPIESAPPFLTKVQLPVYHRPELMKMCIVPHPDSKKVSVNLDIHDLDKLLFSYKLPIDVMFLPIVDKVAEHFYGREIREGNIIYYKVSLIKQQPQVVLTKTKRNVLIPADQIEAMADVFEVPKLEKSRARISFNKVREDALPLYNLGAFNNAQIKGRGILGNNRIVMASGLHEYMVNSLKLSATEENGGYLIGNVYRAHGSPVDEDDADFRWLVEVTQVVPAEGTFGSSLLLLFTGETWSRVNQRIDREFPSQKLVGWYHTHLFAGSDNFGLSELDQVLHRQFFTKPWQVALLLNIEHNQRELRAFQKNLQLQKLEENQYEVFINPAGFGQTV